MQRYHFDTPISCSRPNDYYYLKCCKVIKNINIYMVGLRGDTEQII